MPGFCVFGMTEPLARRLAASKPPPKAMLEAKASDAEIDAWRQAQVEEILKSGKARMVSNEFDAPQFCRDWIDLAQRTVKHSRLKVMVRDIKKDKKGSPVLHKRTKRPLLAWRPL